MIIFLTLCYLGLLFILLKLNIIRINLWWKLSPIVWMLLLLIVLFIPMQWGAPSGDAILVNYVVEVIPNVSGEVVDVPVEPLEILKENDILFRIDPTTYEAEVQRLESALAEAKTNVKRLEATAMAASATVKKIEEQINVLKSEQNVAAAKIKAASAAVAEAVASRDATATELEDRQTQLKFAQNDLARVEALLKKKAATPSDVDRAKVKFTSLKGGVNNAIARLKASEKTIQRREADHTAAKAEEQTVALTIRQTIDADLPRAKAEELEAKLAAESRIGSVHTSVLQFQAQLKTARYNLDETIVRAPGRGYTIGVTLRPGQRVANLPLRSWMAFVNLDQSRLLVNVDQIAIRHVLPGQPAEVTFKVLPGKTFSAVVERLVRLNSAGQIIASGQVPDLSKTLTSPQPLAVVLKLDDALIDQSKLPGGAYGTATVYTNKMKATHLIRKVMIRMDAWMNYVIPW